MVINSLIKRIHSLTTNKKEKKKNEHFWIEQKLGKRHICHSRDSNQIDSLIPFGSIGLSHKLPIQLNWAFKQRTIPEAIMQIFKWIKYSNRYLCLRCNEWHVIGFTGIIYIDNIIVQKKIQLKTEEKLTHQKNTYKQKHNILYSNSHSCWKSWHPIYVLFLSNHQDK